MQDLQRRLGISYLFIAHNLAIVRHISHPVAILYAGRMVELAERENIYARPMHPYKEALLSAVPIANPRIQRGRKRIVHTGEAPDVATGRPAASSRADARCWPTAAARNRRPSPGPGRA